MDDLALKADVIVDALFGTGLAHSEVREPHARWIRSANAARANGGAAIIAVDCPSGLNAQTGAPARECIEADETVTMLAVKRGLLEADALGGAPPPHGLAARPARQGRRTEGRPIPHGLHRFVPGLAVVAHLRPPPIISMVR